MDELEEIRKKKLEQLKEQQLNQIHDQQQDEQQLQEQLGMLEGFVRQRLTKEALERYGNIKVAHPEKAIQLLTILAQLIQTQGVEKIDDTQLKEILKRLTPEKKGPTITRR
ncbi:DNA-binding protein [Nanoarchaeota archaeon]